MKNGSIEGCKEILTDRISQIEHILKNIDDIEEDEADKCVKKRFRDKNCLKLNKIKVVDNISTQHHPHAGRRGLE